MVTRQGRAALGRCQPGMKIDFTSWNFSKKKGAPIIPFFEN